MNTTDPQDELFPIVNAKDEIIGKILRREAHKSPDVIHRAVTVLVFDHGGRILIQKRTMTKDTSPGCWSHSVGGHVGYDEDYLSVAVRETKEEIGINVRPEKFEFLGKMITVAPWEKEMTHVYKYVAGDGINLKPSKDEVSELKFVDIKNLKKMLKAEEWTPSSRQIFDRFLLRG